MIAGAAGLLAVAVVLVVLLAARPSKPGSEAKPAVTTRASPTSSFSPFPTATASPTLEQEREQVRQAFFRYFDVYAAAERSLDPSHLPDVAAGQVLDYATAAVEHARSLNQPWLVRADHTITAVVVTNGLGGPNLGAQVDDTFVDHSVKLDPHTLQPIEADPNAPPQKESLTFQEVAPGVWKAVFASAIN